MSYKVGDRVHHSIYGSGTVIYISSEEDEDVVQYAVNFDQSHQDLHDLVNHGTPILDTYTGYWFYKYGGLATNLSEISLLPNPMKDKLQEAINLLACEVESDYEYFGIPTLPIWWREFIKDVPIDFIEQIKYDRVKELTLELIKEQK